MSKRKQYLRDFISKQVKLNSKCDISSSSEEEAYDSDRDPGWQPEKTSTKHDVRFVHS